MHDDEPCTAFFYYHVLDCPTTIYVYKRVYALSFAMHVGMGIVVLGVSGVKPAREGVLGTLAGVSSKQPIWDRGCGCTPQCIPTCTIFGAQVLGFY
jgi:hypothetical protein